MTFQIIVPGRFIEPSDAIGCRLGMEGWFTLEAMRGGRAVRKHSFKDTGGMAGPFQNLILNQGLDRFATANGNTFIGRIHVGLGTSTPNPTQVQLDNPIGGSINASIDATIPGEAPDYVSRTIVGGLSSIGQFGNANLTEIGVGSTGASDLTSRALIVDSTGEPVAFPISSEEQLRASYEIRLFPPLEDAHYEVNVAGPRDVIVRALNVTNTSAWSVKAAGNNRNAQPQASSAFKTGDLGDITASSAQGSNVPSTGSTTTEHPYSVGSYKQGHRQSYSSTSSVSNSLRTHEVGYTSCRFQVQYDPPLQKTADQTMFLEYELAWGRR